MIIDFPWYFILLCLLLGLIYAALLYRHSMPYGRWRWPLFALRTLAVAAISLLLLSPMSKQTIHEKQKPTIILAQDLSQSIRLSRDSAFTLQPLADQLNGNFDIVYQPFGSSLTTDIAEAIATASNNREVAAMILASDGIYNHGANPITEAEHTTFPIHTVALGDTTPPRDATIAHLLYNRIAFLGTQFPIEATIVATQLPHRNATLTVSHNNRILYSQRIEYTTPNFSTTIPISLPAETPGLQRYTINITPLDDETITSNNQQSFYIDIIDSRQRIAIVANAPHPDIAALVRSIESNPNYEATLILADDLHKTNLANEHYNLAILHNLPSATHPSIDFADQLPKIFILGPQTDLPRFNNLHLGLEIVSKTPGKTTDVTALHQPSFSLFNLDPTAATTIEQLPPLATPAGIFRQQPACQTLFTSQLGNIDTRQPLIAASSMGNTRCAFICGNGLWRWRLAEYATSNTHTAVDQLITQLITYTSLQTSRDQLRVEAERLYTFGTATTLRAQLYNDAYELINTPDIQLTLNNPDLDNPLTYTFARQGNAYRLNIPDLAEGIYHYTATTTLNNRQLTTTGTFAIEAINLEQRNLVADHALLATLSHSTSGLCVPPDQLLALTQPLSSLKPTIYTHTRYADFLHLPLVLALILLLLAAEWAIRKHTSGL